MLISYLDSKKIVSIPSSGNIDTLERFWKEFDLKEASKNYNVVYQRLDQEWDEYIDLEPETTLFHKDKLKAVTLPKICISETDLNVSHIAYFNIIL